MKAMFELRLVLDIDPPKPATEAALHSKLLICQGLASKYLNSVGIKTVNATYNARKMTKDERMALVPVSVHFIGPQSITACGRMVARKITSHWGKVTCKRCLAHRPASLQGELFK